MLNMNQLHGLDSVSCRRKSWGEQLNKAFIMCMQMSVILLGFVIFKIAYLLSFGRLQMHSIPTLCVRVFFSACVFVNQLVAFNLPLFQLSHTFIIHSRFATHKMNCFHASTSVLQVF